MISLKTFEKSPYLAELKISYKRRRPPTLRTSTARRGITSSLTAEEYLRSVWNRDTLELTEDFLIVCLNGAHEPLGWVKISSGGFSAATVDPRVVFGVALQAASTALILAHNHPGGSTTPSDQDLRLTRQLVEAGKLLGIAVLDHIILTRDGAVSLADRGLI